MKDTRILIVLGLLMAWMGVGKGWAQNEKWDGKPNEKWAGDYTSASPGQSTYEIHTAGDLAQLAVKVNSGLSFEGKTVVLKAHLDLSTPDHQSWIPIGNDEHPFKGTFDGYAYTIKNLFIDRDERNLGLFGKIDEQSVVDRLHLQGIVKGADDVAGIVGHNMGTIQYCSFEGVVASDYRAGGIAGRNGVFQKGLIKNCYTTALVYSKTGEDGAITGWNEHIFENCFSVSNSRKTPHGELIWINNYSIRPEDHVSDQQITDFMHDMNFRFATQGATYDPQTRKLTFAKLADFPHEIVPTFDFKEVTYEPASDLVYTGQPLEVLKKVMIDGEEVTSGFKMLYADGDHTNAGTRKALLFFDQPHAFPANHPAVIAYTIQPATLLVVPDSNQVVPEDQADYSFTFTCTGAANGETPAFSGALMGENGKITAGTLKLKDNKTFRASNYTLVVKEGVPYTGESSGGAKWSGKANADWASDYTTSNPGQSTYAIQTAEDLAQLAVKVNSGLSFEGKTVKLANHIDLDNKPWSPIGTTYCPFRGVFNGEGFTIENLFISNASDEQGLFGVIESGEITNTHVQGNVRGFMQVGGIAGFSASEIKNCGFSGSVYGFAYVGGIVGTSMRGVTYCYNIASVGASVTDEKTWGGILGSNNDYYRFCFNISNAGLCGEVAFDTESNYSLNPEGNISEEAGKHFADLLNQRFSNQGALYDHATRSLRLPGLTGNPKERLPKIYFNKVSYQQASHFVYNGQPQDPFSKVEIDGQVTTNYRVLYEHNDPIHAGTRDALLVFDRPYAFTSAHPAFITCTIERAPLVVVPDSNQFYPSGMKDFVFTFTYSGAVEGETPAFSGALKAENGVIKAGSLKLEDNGTFRASDYTLVVKEDVPYKGDIQVGTEAIERPDFSARVSNGSIVIDSPAPTVVRIFDFKGRVLRDFSVPAGTTYCSGLSKGVYIIHSKWGIVKLVL